MPNLLMEIKGNMSLNATIFPPSLRVFDDVLIYRKRHYHQVREITISYTHIVQVNLLRGIFFASLDIINSGAEDISIRFVPKKQAVKAKVLIDTKIHRGSQKDMHFTQSPNGEVHSFEKSVSRLRELLNKGKISEREYKSRRAKLLKNVS